MVSTNVLIFGGWVGNGKVYWYIQVTILVKLLFFITWFYGNTPKKKIPESWTKKQKKKNIWNMKMTVIPIIVRALGTIPKDWRNYGSGGKF